LELDSCTKVFSNFNNKKHPDIIFLDYTIACESWNIFLEQAKKNQEYRDVPIFILTGPEETVIDKNTLSGLKTDFIKKPLSEPDIISRIKICVG